MNEWEAYLPFCQSERQAQVISLRAQGMTAEKAAEVMGINKRNVDCYVLRGLKSVAAKARLRT
jgi:transcriptional regulator